MLPDLGVTHAVLLQGPAGPFMARFGAELRDAGIHTTKVNFHAGDDFFYRGPDVVPFKEPFERWEGWFRALIEERGIDGLFLFGDCRPLHRMAIEIAEARGVRVYVFEEGYLRPDWITLEAHGVNGHSHLPRDPEFYRALELPDVPDPIDVGPRFHLVAWYSSLNALAYTLWDRGYEHYHHHRHLNAWHHMRIHCWSVVRKEIYARREAHLTPRFEGELRRKYFFVPLQVHNDFQLVHSPYDDVLQMAREVAHTFARHADPRHSLVFKHHPMDRPYKEYGRFFEELQRSSGLGERLIYCHDLHLPTILKNALGTITINSTVGLSSLYHATPVITLGTAVYDMPGMTHQGSLESFLAHREPPDRDLFEKFCRYLTHVNQANGSLYKPIEALGTPTGIRWWKGLPAQREAHVDARSERSP